jgi:hypothetical protein
MAEITHSVSGELWDVLRWGTTLDDGTAKLPVWGYGRHREADIEVHTMVHASVMTKRGFGSSHAMTGSRDAWHAISAYAEDIAYIELNGDGDFDRGKGTRLRAQAAKIDALLDSGAGV